MLAKYFVKVLINRIVSLVSRMADLACANRIVQQHR